MRTASAMEVDGPWRWHAPAFHFALSRQLILQGAAAAAACLGAATPRSRSDAHRSGNRYVALTLWGFVSVLAAVPSSAFGLPLCNCFDSAHCVCVGAGSCVVSAQYWGLCKSGGAGVGEQPELGLTTPQGAEPAPEAPFTRRVPVHGDR